METLQKKVMQLETLFGLASLINSSLDHEEIRKKAIEVTTKMLNAEAASLLLLDNATGELHFDVATGEKAEKVKQVRMKKGTGIAGWVAEHGEPLIIQDALSDPRVFKTADRVSGFVTKNIICVPVKSKEQIIGVLEGINKLEGQFDEDDLEIIKAVSNSIAIAIENARLYTEMKETFFNLIETLVETVELRDTFTGGHTKRMVEYCLDIGRHIGLDRKECEDLKLAAMLHDIGKIGVRDDILLKQGKLKEEEFEDMKMHSLHGAELLKNIRRLKKVIPGIRSHHERYDGNGYPEGLKDKKIPLIARIIAVVDSFDAMTNSRPYRKGHSRDAAFEELKRCSGSQFDPAVVDAFLEVFSKGDMQE